MATESLANCRTGADEIALIVGREWWFEYHCSEDHRSQDAQLWYHSHQKILILRVVEHDADLAMSREDRAGNGTPIAYQGRFRDGYEHTVLDDEVLESRKGFYRPDPPKMIAGGPGCR